jgi:AraC-like DNA-binding protein
VARIVGSRQRENAGDKEVVVVGVSGPAGPLVVSTDQVASSEQFDYWHSMLVRYYVDVDASAHASPSRGFAGRLRRTRFGGCAVDEVRAEPIRVNRSPAAVRRNPGDYYQLAVLRDGAATVIQNGRAATQTRPGDFLLFDAARPYIFEFEASTWQILFQLPRELVESELPDAHNLTAITAGAEHGIARVASRMLLSLCENDEDRSDQASFSAMSATVTLAVTALRERTGRARAAHPAEVLLAEARDYMMRNMADHDAVTPRRVAAAIHISERYLFKLFEQSETTPQGWLRCARLDRARRILEEPVNRLTVREIAAAVGFTSPAHFSRAFSSRFGLSPSEARERARQP